MTRRQRLRADLWQAIRVWGRRMREADTLDEIEAIARAERAVNRCIAKIEAEQAAGIPRQEGQ